MWKLKKAPLINNKKSNINTSSGLFQLHRTPFTCRSFTYNIFFLFCSLLSRLICFFNRYSSYVMYAIYLYKYICIIWPGRIYTWLTALEVAHIKPNWLNVYSTHSNYVFIYLFIFWVQKQMTTYENTYDNVCHCCTVHTSCMQSKVMSYTPLLIK